MANGDKLQDLLLREREGTLSGEEQAAIGRLREAGELPAALPKAGAPTGPEPSAAAQFVRRAAIPTAAGAIGGGLGAAAGVLAGPAAPLAVPTLGLIGEMTFSAGGEALNQLLGITEPSLGEIGLAAAMPPAARGVGRATLAGVRRLPRILPGAGPALHEVAVERAQGIPAIVRPAVDPETLWAPLERVNPRLVTTNFANTVDTLLREAKTASPGLRPGPLINRLTAIKGDLERYGNDVPFQVLKSNQREIGALTRSEDARLATAAKRLFGAIEDDLEANASLRGQPAQLVEQFRAAREATRQEKTAETLAKLVKDYTPRSPDTGAYTLNMRGLQKAIDTDPLLQKFLSPEHRKDIEGILRMVRGLPSAAPPRATGIIDLPRAISGLAAGGYGYGYDPGTAMFAGAAGLLLPWVVGKGLATDSGRALLRRALEAEGGQLSASTLVALANALRGGTAPAPGEPVRIGPVPGLTPPRP